MSRSGATILVVDDEQDTREILQRTLSAAGFDVCTAGSVPEAVAVLDRATVDLVITDIKMPKISGLDLVRHVRENLPETEVIVITGYASIAGTVEAMQAGATEYLAKPFTGEELLSPVRRVLEKLQTRRAARRMADDNPLAGHGIRGESPAMREVFRAVAKAATTTATVLISGESGTGKELVARAIHYGSGRASAPFIPVNCGAIPSELVESELFGHMKGSFTGATDSRAGFFQTADGGSIFLDEISEMSLAMQVKLLRVLQDKEVWMVGATRARKVDVRVLAATNKQLPSLVQKGSFRDDLYFRLSVITITVPPLRERSTDVLLLAHHFVSKFAGEAGKPAMQFSDRALEALRNYAWPGNVRELENLMQRLVIMKEDSLIDITDLPPAMRFSIARESGMNRPLAEVEAEHIKNVLASVDGNKTRAAQILGIDRKTLREKLKSIETD